MSGTIQYTIRPFDTLYMLAQVFHTSVDSIMSLNPGISPEKLQVGHVITIMPGFQFVPFAPGTRMPAAPTPTAPMPGTRTPTAPMPGAPATTMPGAPMTGTRTPTTAMPGAPMTGAPTTTMPGAPMPGAPTTTMPGAPMTGTRTPTTAMPGAPMTGTRTPTTTMPGAPMPGAPTTTMPGAPMTGTRTPTTAMPGAPMTGTRTPTTAMPGAPMPGAPMTGAPMTGTRTPTTAMPGAPMTGTRTPTTAMPGAPMTGAPTTAMPGAPVTFTPAQGQEIGRQQRTQPSESMSENPRDFGECDGMMEDLDKFFRMLWEQHITWTRLVAMGIVDDLPETDLMVKRLQRNAADFGNAFRTYYGDETGDEFAKLMAEHISIAAEIVKNAKAGDSNAVAEAEQRWFENASEIAEFLGRINPYWNADDWSAMMNEHLELLRENILNMLSQNYEESINGYDDIEAQALEMADMMAEGLSMQFSE